MSQTAENNKRNFEKILSRSLKMLEYSFAPRKDCPFFPEHVHIEPTNICNFQCIHCHQSMIGKKFTKKLGFMDFALYKKLIDEISALSERITLNQQGEPLLHPEILNMIAYAKKKGLNVSLLTNASYLDENITEELLKLKLDRIVFSFDAADKKIYEQIRRRSDFHLVLKNILHFMKKKFEEGGNTFICMSIIDQKLTHNHINNYKKYFNKLPVNTIFVSPLLNISGGSLTSKEIKMEKYLKIPKEKQPTCRVPWMNIVVNWDGTVSPCPLDFNETHIVGDINKESLFSIWNNKNFRAFRAAHIKREFDGIEKKGPLCATCSCRFLEEYDLKDYRNYAEKFICRQFDVITKGKSNNVKTSSEKLYNNLLKELQKINIADGAGKGYA